MKTFGVKKAGPTRTTPSPMHGRGWAKQPAYSRIQKTARGLEPEHTHERPGLRIVYDGAIGITQQGKTTRYQTGDDFFEGGHVPHTVKVPGPAAFRTLYVEILPEG